MTPDLFPCVYSAYYATISLNLCLNKIQGDTYYKPGRRERRYDKINFLSWAIIFKLMGFSEESDIFIDNICHSEYPTHKKRYLKFVYEKY